MFIFVSFAKKKAKKTRKKKEGYPLLLSLLSSSSRRSQYSAGGGVTLWAAWGGVTLWAACENSESSAGFLLLKMETRIPQGRGSTESVLCNSNVAQRDANPANIELHDVQLNVCGICVALRDLRDLRRCTTCNSMFAGFASPVSAYSHSWILLGADMLY
jgi:hypothetical protein